MTDINLYLQSPREDCLYTPRDGCECSPYGGVWLSPGFSIAIVVETLETLWAHLVSLHLSLPDLTDHTSVFVLRDDGQAIECEVDWEGLPRITFRADLFAFGQNRFAVRYR